MRYTSCKSLPSVCLLALAFAPAVAQAQGPAIPFLHDYSQARQEAEKKGLPLVLYFTTDNCPWCVRLVNETFGDAAVSKLMTEKFVLLKVHARHEPILVEKLAIPYFPTVVLAAPDGKILGRVEGFQEPGRFHDSLQRALASVTNPEWMQRDYQIACKSVEDRDYGRAVALLRTILEDGKTRPVQVSAAGLLRRVEQQAASELGQAKMALDRGQTNEGTMMLAKLVKDYAGTSSAPEAAGILTSLAKSPESRSTPRAARARELLAQAKEDFRTEQWLCCLDRCDLVIANYGDLSESRDALQMAGAIRSNPDWMQKTCESLSARLSDMYIGLAETWVQKGQPQQAMLCLERVIRSFPGTRQAEMAQYRMAQLQALPSQRGFPELGKTKE